MPDTVQSLLAASKAAHARYRRLAGTIDKRGSVASPPHYPSAEREVRDALKLRLEAHDADPTHADPQWAADEPQWPHEKLVAFYRNYLVIP